MLLNELLDKLCGDITIEINIEDDDGACTVKSLTLDEYRNAASHSKSDEFSHYVVDEISLSPFYNGDIAVDVHESIN